MSHVVHFSYVEGVSDAVMRRVEPQPLTASIDVAAPPAQVWSVLSDVRRTGEWSPECLRVLPLSRVRVGALLIGVNHRKRVRWVTLSRVINYWPDQEIGWVVLTNRSEWRYHLQPSGTGTSITHTRRTPRGESRFALVFTQALLGGQARHDAELEQGMHDGLRRIKAIVEALNHAVHVRSPLQEGTQ
jgi:uncharacterized protein YndB with AHSA1/START domain